jgi:AcrR family transcriptional regulator
MSGKSGAEPVRLDPDKIVTAALNVADQHGIAGMTLRMVGAQLGADPTALYRHFASKDALVTAMADRLFADVLDIELPRGWRPRLMAVLRAARDIYRSHPSIVETLANHPETTQGVLDINEVILGCLREAGLDEQLAGRFHQVLASYVVGAGLLDAAWDNPASGVREASRRWYSALDPAEYPNSVATAAHLFPPADDVFEFAIDVTLDAVAVAARNRLRTSTKRRTAAKRATPPKRVTPAKSATSAQPAPRQATSKRTSR